MHAMITSNMPAQTRTIETTDTAFATAFEAESYQIFRKYYGLLEKRRWSIDDVIPWEHINPAAVPLELQQLLYTSSLIESFTFTTTPNFLRKHSDKPWIISLQMARGYEECKHSNALWRYLECLGFPVDSTQLTALQQVPDSSDRLSLFERNTYAWLSEVETLYFYQALSNHVGEPVGQKLLALISQDESVHGAFLFDTMKLELSLDPGNIHMLHHIVTEYQNPSKESHYGAVIGESFQQARLWAEQVGASVQIARHISQKLALLMNAG